MDRGQSIRDCHWQLRDPSDAIVVIGSELQNALRHRHHYVVTVHFLACSSVDANTAAVGLILAVDLFHLLIQLHGHSGRQVIDQKLVPPFVVQVAALVVHDGVFGADLIPGNAVPELEIAEHASTVVLLSWGQEPAVLFEEPVHNPFKRLVGHFQRLVIVEFDPALHIFHHPVEFESVHVQGPIGVGGIELHVSVVVVAVLVGVKRAAGHVLVENFVGQAVVEPRGTEVVVEAQLRRCGVGVDSAANMVLGLEDHHVLGRQTGPWVVQEGVGSLEARNSGPNHANLNEHGERGREGEGEKKMDRREEMRED